MSLKVGVLSLGCPRNLVDSESMLGRLAAKGHRIVDMHEADIGIVNTCAFIEDAKRESIDAILDCIDLKNEGRLKKIIVCGCLPQRYRQKLHIQLPEVDAFVGSPSLNHGLARYAITPRHFAYLKICESCIHACSYCIIPKIKGKFASLAPEMVLQKAAAFNREGIAELNIIGQDITGYGLDLYRRSRLAELLKNIATCTPRIGWLRLLYLYPGRAVEDILKIMRDTPRICRYIDLPVQHVNGRILKKMRRDTTKTEIIRLIDTVRKILPHAAIRTSVIVGFPTETQKEFQELVAFIKDAKFERLGAFAYSREDGTPAYRMPGQVAPRVVQERFQTVMLAQQQISCAINQRYLGTTMQVLIDEVEKDHYLGRTEYDAPEVDGCVYVTAKRALSPGEFVRVRVTDTLEYDLVGEEVS